MESKRNKKYNFDHFYNPLIVLSNIVCLPIPKTQTKNGNQFFFLAYASVIIIILIYGSIWSVNAMTVLYAKGATLYLEILIIWGMVLTNVISILWCVLVRRKSMVKLVETFGQVDNNLNVNEQYKSGGYLRFMSEIVFLYLFAIACGIYESYTIINVLDLDHYYSHVLFYINLFMVVLTVLKIYHISMAIKYRFGLLNRNMLRSQHKLTITIISVTTNEQRLVEFYRKIHLLLSDCINLMNDVFGIQILLITMLIIIFIVHAFNAAVQYGRSKFEDQTETYELIFVCVWNTSIFIIFAYMMASSCEQVIDEKNKSQRICHKLLTRFPIKMTRTQEVLREELCVFAAQIEQFDVRFSAMGFFNVDHTLLLTVFGSIAAYIIVLMQFR